MLSSALRDFLLHGGGGGEVDDFDGLPDAGTAAENHEEGVNSKIKGQKTPDRKKTRIDEVDHEDRAGNLDQPGGRDADYKRYLRVTGAAETAHCDETRRIKNIEQNRPVKNRYNKAFRQLRVHSRRAAARTEKMRKKLRTEQIEQRGKGHPRDQHSPGTPADPFRNQKTPAADVLTRNDARRIHQTDHRHVADHVYRKRNARRRKRFVACVADHHDNNRKGGVADERLESGGRAETEKFAENRPVKSAVGTGCIFALVVQQETGRGNSQRTEVCNGVRKSGAENPERGKPKFAENQKVIQRNIDAAADDFHLGDKACSAASGEK